MDATILEQVASYLWPLVVSGAATQIGEASAGQAGDAAQTLIQRLRRDRTERGTDDPPTSVAELEEELGRLLSEPDGRQLIQTVHQHIQTVHQNFQGTITGGQFGINNNF